jgi:hypothetical protein
MMTDFNTHEVNVIANGLKHPIGRHSSNKIILYRVIQELFENEMKNINNAVVY